MAATRQAPPITGRHCIKGEWLASNFAHFESRNPAHQEEVVGAFPRGAADQANQAVVAARAAYPAWRRTSRIRRAELFDHLAQIVKREQDRLAELMARECGKVI